MSFVLDHRQNDTKTPGLNHASLRGSLSKYYIEPPESTVMTVMRPKPSDLSRLPNSFYELLAIIWETGKPPTDTCILSVV